MLRPPNVIDPRSAAHSYTSFLVVGQRSAFHIILHQAKRQICRNRLKMNSKGGEVEGKCQSEGGNLETLKVTTHEQEIPLKRLRKTDIMA